MPLGASAGPVTSALMGWLAEELAGRRAALTSLHASELLVRALGDISRGHNRRDIAAGLIVAMGSGHGRHSGGLDAALD
jgi:hypothetical protein